MTCGLTVRWRFGEKITLQTTMHPVQGRTSILGSGTYHAHIKKTLCSNGVFLGGYVSQNDSSYEESSIARVRFPPCLCPPGLYKRGTTIHDPWNKAEGYASTQMQNHELSEPSCTGIILRQRVFSRYFFQESSPSECPSFATAGALFFGRVLSCKVQILNSCKPTLSIARCLANRFPFKGKSTVLKSSFSLVPTLLSLSSSSWSIVFSNDKTRRNGNHSGVLFSPGGRNLPLRFAIFVGWEWYLPSFTISSQYSNHPRYRRVFLKLILFCSRILALETTRALTYVVSNRMPISIHDLLGYPTRTLGGTQPRFKTTF